MSWNIEQCKTFTDWAIEAYTVSKEEYLELWKLCVIQARKSGNKEALTTAKARVKQLEAELKNDNNYSNIILKGGES